jgi:hypothetical protein
VADALLNQAEAEALCRAYFGTARRELSMVEFVMLKCSCSTKKAGEIIELAQAGRSWFAFCAALAPAPPADPPRARAPGESSSPMPDPLSPEEAAQELEEQTRRLGSATGELIEGAERPEPSPAALELCAEMPSPLQVPADVQASPYSDLEPAEAWAIEGALRQLGPQELRQRTRMAERCARDVLRGEPTELAHVRGLLEDREAAIAELRAVLAGGGHLWQVEALVRDRLAPFVADTDAEGGERG